MRARRVVVVLVTGLCLAAVPPAFAGSTKVYDPPGKAGANEYAEVVPSSGGNVSTPALGGGNTTPAQISHLGAGRAGVKALAKLGKQGAGAAAFAEETAPAPAISIPRRVVGGKRRPQPVLLRAPAGSPLSGLGRLLSGADGGGIGIVLPLLLAGGLAGALGFMLARALSGREPHA